MIRAATLLAVLAPALLADPVCDTLALSAHLPRIQAGHRAAGARRLTAPGARPAPRFAPGQKREFWAWDLAVMPPGFRRVTATCRVVTDTDYLFVEDELATAGKVTDADVRILDQALHARTPDFSVAPGRGIVDLETEHLGTPPDALDGDPRVYFLVLRMDTFNGMGFDGYFNAFDQLPEAVAWEQYQQHSNESEVLYLNGLRGDISGSYMRGVLAHELAHLIEHAYDGEEEPWLGETLGEAAMQLTGYYTDQRHVERYAAKPERPVVSQGYASYGGGFLLAAWLRGLYGPRVWGALLRDGGHGTASVEGVLASLGHPRDFAGLYAAWAADNLWAGQRRPVKAYRHPGMIVPPFKIHATAPETGGTVAGQLEPWGCAFVALAPGSWTVARTGGAEAYELLPGRAPRPVSLDGAVERLETLDEPRWLLLVGKDPAAKAWSLTLGR